MIRCIDCRAPVFGAPQGFALAWCATCVEKNAVAIIRAPIGQLSEMDKVSIANALRDIAHDSDISPNRARVFHAAARIISECAAYHSGVVNPIAQIAGLLDERVAQHDRQAALLVPDSAIESNARTDALEPGDGSEPVTNRCNNKHLGENEHG